MLHTNTFLHLALYQPEIPQNTGTLIRLGACMGVALHIISPCGFVWSNTKLKRAGMDYEELANVYHHDHWDAFQLWANGRRLILIDVAGETDHWDYTFQQEDVLVLGQESVGVPSHVANTFCHKVKIPMVSGRRSLNVAIAGAMVISEALRQIRVCSG